MITILLILLALIALGVLVLVVLGIAIYNSLVTLRQTVKNAWAQIDVQLKRRHDLIPNLVNTVKGYASHEKETLDRVINARANATKATLPADAIKAEGELSGALARLMAVAEAYPDLKANQNFLALQEELVTTENKISFARQFYNDSVTRYNTKRETFPTVLIAGILGFHPEVLFEVEEEAKQETVENKQSVVILMHDAEAKKVTVEALPCMINYLKEQGYTFVNFYEIIK